MESGEVLNGTEQSETDLFAMLLRPHTAIHPLGCLISFEMQIMVFGLRAHILIYQRIR